VPFVNIVIPVVICGLTLRLAAGALAGALELALAYSY